MENMSPSSVAETISELPPGSSTKPLPLPSSNDPQAAAPRKARSGRVPFNRSASMPLRPNDDEGSKDSLATASLAGRSADDIDAHRRRETMADFESSNVTISDSTRRILERMSENQLQDAKQGLLEFKQRRRASGLDGIGSILQRDRRLSKIVEIDEIGDSTRSNRRGSVSDRLKAFVSHKLPSFNDELEDIEEGVQLRRESSKEDKVIVGDPLGSMKEEDEMHKALGGMSLGFKPRAKNGKKDERGFSRSMITPHDPKLLADDNMSSEEEDDAAAVKPRRKSNNKKDERRFSKSMNDHDPKLFEDDDSDEGDEDDEEESFKGEREFKSVCASLNMNVDFDPKSKKDESEGGAREDHDEALGRMARKHSGSHSVDPRMMTSGDPSSILPDAKGGRRRASEEAPSEKLPGRRPARERHNALLTQSCSAAKEKGEWRPLSSSASVKKDDDYDPDEEENKKRKKKNSRSAPTEQGGIGGLWNKLTSSFTAESNPISESELSANKTPIKPKKEIDGATYFRRGKKKMEKNEYLQAVALFNFALVKQREELGENHIDCGTTLNEIGTCWMMMGERYPALTAFEESLYIRQRKLGDGAMEVAETTNNIWMILHEERCEMEEAMAEEGAD